MNLPQRLTELHSRVQIEGWRPLSASIARAARDRLAPPWENLYCAFPREVPSSEIDEKLRLVVASAVAPLDEELRAAFARSSGHDALTLSDDRLRRGAELHCLEVGGEIVASRYVVAGTVCRFQHVPLCDWDAMGMDLRVPPAARGQGFSKALLAASIAELGRRGFERIFAHAKTNNPRSNQALLSVGFRFLVRYRADRGRYRYDMLAF